MAKNKSRTGELFSHILSIEDLISDVESGTITQNDLVDSLEALHKKFSDYLGKIANENDEVMAGK
jgi:hypothetical protein